MRVLAAPAKAELIRQRSRFLGQLELVSNPDEARAKLKQAKGFYGDADHVVHAFRVGFEAAEIRGCGDDGEPSGTAGRPALEVLSGQGGGNCLLLIVRWFGGTKLGTGGLVQAYSETAKAVIASASWEEWWQWTAVQVSVGFAEHRPLRTLLEELGALIDSEDFDAEVHLKARIPQDFFETLQRRTVDLTRGRASWRKL
jgi:uncharacterized YigZ family protein